MEANREYLRSGHRATQAQQLVAVAITSEHAPHLTKCYVCRRTVWGRMQLHRFSTVQNSRFLSDKER
jgi:hypothetical protein